MLEELVGDNLRNLGAFTIHPGSGLNVITGRNAAGKTSILEAIYFLSLGRSFRTSRLDDIPCSGTRHAWVRGVIRSPSGITRLGIARSDGKTLCRINGQTVSSASALAQCLPVQIIHPESHRLLSGGPAHRRAYMDWGCFYESESFFPVWTRFRRALKQRNEALKSRADDRTLAAFERELSITSDFIDQMRSNYIERLQKSMHGLTVLWPDECGFELEYRRGWGQERSLEQILLDERDQARKIGHTLAGPHRAELTVRSNGERVASIFSRGQLKRAAAALLLAQTTAFEQSMNRDVLVLVDDLPSELDTRARNILLRTLVERRGQSFITALDAEDLSLTSSMESRMFHVEHGRLTELI